MILNIWTTNRVLVASNTTTNRSVTEIIQTGLQCATRYYTRVIVIGEPRYQGVPEEQLLFSSQVRLLIGGKEIACMRFQSQQPDGVVISLHMQQYQYYLE